MPRLQVIDAVQRRGAVKSGAAPASTRNQARTCAAVSLLRQDDSAIRPDSNPSL
jgi:hypothetical protein